MAKRVWGEDHELALERMDASSGSDLVIEYEHYEIHEGDHYFLSHSVADIGAATTPDDAVTLTFVTPNTTKWLHMVAEFAACGGALCRIREGGTGGASPAGTVTARNSNRNSSNTSGMLDIASAAGKASYDAGLDTGGTLLVDEYLPGAATNQSALGQESGRRHEWVLKQNTRYQISIVSTANLPATIELSWYEHTDRH